MHNITALDPIMFEDQPMRRTACGMVSVFDLIRVVGGQKNPHEVWAKLHKDFPEVLDKILNLKFPGRGQKETPCATKEGALQIIGLLPGAAGKKYRAEAASLVLKWYEAPAELAKLAIAQIEDKSDLEEVLSEAQQKYLSKYHPLFDEIGDRMKDGYAIEGVAVVKQKTTQACINVNTLNTSTVLGKKPKDIVAERGGENARSHLSVAEYSRYSILQDSQLMALQRRPEVAKASEVNATCREAARKFAEYWDSL